MAKQAELIYSTQFTHTMVNHALVTFTNVQTTQPTPNQDEKQQQFARLTVKILRPERSKAMQYTADRWPRILRCIFMC